MAMTPRDAIEERAREDLLAREEKTMLDALGAFINADHNNDKASARVVVAVLTAHQAAIKIAWQRAYDLGIGNALQTLGHVFPVSTRDYSKNAQQLAQIARDQQRVSRKGSTPR